MEAIIFGCGQLTTLLAPQLVEDGYRVTVLDADRECLELLEAQWCIPKVSAEFVACMEDVLDLYAEPYDPKRPVVCFDETSKQLVAEKRAIR